MSVTCEGCTGWALQGPGDVVAKIKGVKVTLAHQEPMCIILYIQLYTIIYRYASILLLKGFTLTRWQKQKENLFSGAVGLWFVVTQEQWAPSLSPLSLHRAQFWFGTLTISAPSHPHGLVGFQINLGFPSASSPCLSGTKCSAQLWCFRAPVMPANLLRARFKAAPHKPKPIFWLFSALLLDRLTREELQLRGVLPM